MPPRLAHASGSRRVLVGFVLVLCVAVWPAVALGAWRAGPPTLVAVLLGLLLPVSRALPMLQLHRSREVQGITLDEAVLVALLFVGSAGHAGLIFGLGAAIGHALIRPTGLKVAFNAAQAALAATLASAAFVAIDPPADVFAPRSVLAAAAATAIYAITTHLLVAELFRRMHGQTWRATASGFVRMIGWSTVATLVLGLLLAELALTDLRGVALGLAVVVAAHVGFAGYAMAVAERHRAELLQDTTMTLVAAASGDFAEFVRHTAILFSAGTAELVLEDPEGTRRLIWSDGEMEQRVDPLPADHPALVARVSGRPVTVDRDTGDGVQTALAAPIIEVGTEWLGALVVEGRDGVGSWGDQDASLLASLANDVAVALANVRLLSAVQQERERLAQESAKLVDVMRATSDGMVVLDEHGVVTVWNAAMGTITGVAAIDAVGRPWDLVLRLRDADGLELVDPAASHPVTRALAGQGDDDFGMDLQTLRRDGEWRWVACSVSPIRSRVGVVQGVVLVARDVTSAREVDQLKTDFIATVSHELRTPLTPLQGFVETLASFGDRITAEQRDQIVASMRRQIDRLRFLMDDLMLVADRHQGRNQRLTRAAIDLNEVVDETVSRLMVERRVRVLVDAAPGVHGIGDPRAVVRILDELLDNALVHTDGDVRVKVAANEHWATVEVSDTGPGIAPWDQERVFAQFGRLGDHLHRPAGAGLGLAIARALARDLDGDLVLDSDVGHGSTFRLQVPSWDERVASPHQDEPADLLPRL